MTQVTIKDLTTGATDGTGVFDQLMKAAKGHIEQEFLQNRIKGPEYSQVYLAALTQILQTSVQFLATSQKIDLEAQLLQAQIDLTNAQKELVEAQLEGLDTDKLLKEAQIKQIEAETLITPLKGDQLKAQTDLVKQQGINAVQELANLKAQECLLKSQFDASKATVLNTGAQTDLLKQKIVTEKAQTTELGVDDNSVLGKQKKLYQAQTDGFTRDAEQKATKLMLDTWSARRMTDADGAVADSVNHLDDPTIGRFVNQLAKGIGA